MPVDPTKTREVLVIHGVQTGTDRDLEQDILIRDLISSRLGNNPLQFSTSMYKYENINDEALGKLKELLLLLRLVPVGTQVAANVIDLVMDVVVAKRNTGTAAKIRAGLEEKILEIYQREAPCYIVAHSLGSIYAFDVINKLMRDDSLFDRGSRKTWPVQGLVSMGSPIGLPMFNQEPGRKTVAYLGEGTKWFRWHNYYDLADPVVSGNILGKQLQGYKIAENYLKNSTKQGWIIRDRQLDTGKVWLMAHVAYWENPIIGDGLVDMITN
jgi:hypothetical protein